MTTIYLASYTGKQKGIAGIFNIGIKWLTRSRFSHTEICIGNPFEAAVPCLSSSGVDGGVRMKGMKLSPEKWEILPMPWVTEEQVQQFLAEHKGTGYDWAGVVRFVFPWLRAQSKRRWFCTECVAAIAGYPDAWRFSPADFHIIVEARNK
jgi:hypothetical protein